MQSHGTWFKEWFNSPYYHLLYSDRDDNEAATLIDHLIARLQPAKDATMLDVACGRGRHAKILAEKGFDVTGIDLAPSSIIYARQFENDHLHFYEHDMRMLFRINYFDYAFNFFTSFGYFVSEREHNSAMRTISQSLKKNGVFVLDYLNAHYAEEHLVNEMTKKSGSVIFKINKWCDDLYFYKKIVIEDPELNEPLEFTERIRKFALDDFTKMFSLQQLNINAFFGDYTLNPFDVKTSPRLILIAQKK
ncbi:MAG: class I SAM-dependent methyltransferase [Bacteroidetes bacterium]|nr:class I SAM-dependent methyltransferase [Bacteroidota bacterium]